MPLEKRGRKEKADAKEKSIARRKQRKAKKDGVVLKKGRPSTKSQSQKSQSQSQSQNVNITIGDTKKTRSKSAPRKPKQEPASIPQDLRPTINIPAQPDYSGVFQALIQQRPSNETPLSRSMYENMILREATINEPEPVRRHGRTANLFQPYPSANVLSPIVETTPINETSQIDETSPIDESEPVARARPDIDPTASVPFITDEPPMDSGLISLMMPTRPEPSKMKTNIAERRKMATEDEDAQSVISDITEPYHHEQEYAFSSQPSERTLMGDFGSTLSTGSLLYDPRKSESTPSMRTRLISDFDKDYNIMTRLDLSDKSSEQSIDSSIRSEQPALSKKDAIRTGYEDQFDKALSRNELFTLPSKVFEGVNRKQSDIYNEWFANIPPDLAYVIRESDNFPEIDGDFNKLNKGQKKKQAKSLIREYKAFKVPSTDLNVLGLIGLKYPEIKTMVMNNELGKRNKEQYQKSINALKKLQDIPESEAQVEAVETTEQLERLLPTFV